jgi:ectoine hydroxylase-related dioxygenase (phytanoyl-CoA dioxygenase family)
VSLSHKLGAALTLGRSFSRLHACSALSGYGVSLTDKTTAAMVVPGSHKWPRDREPDLSEAVLVNIPKGAALITVASTWHGMTPVTQPSVRRSTTTGLCC